jgi:uncharacterized DUF497 family protein
MAYLLALDNNEIKYSACGLFFTWDDAKNEENIRKHDRISFHIAAEVLCDPGVVYLEPYRRDREIRWDAIGRPSPEEDVVLFVVVIERVNRDNVDVIRIISARRADLYEEGLYYVEQDGN